MRDVNGRGQPPIRVGAPRAQERKQVEPVAPLIEIEVVEAELDDAWMRDIGPTFVHDDR
jgi:agmatine deiminase